MKKLLLTVSALFSFILPVQAMTIADVAIEPQISYEEQDLNLYGAGIRSKYFMNLYVGSLYAAESGLDQASLLSADQLSAMRLNIISGMITSDRMIDTVEDGFKDSTGNNVAPLRDRIDTLLALFDSIAVDDQFTFVSAPGVGVVAYKNGEHLSTIEGDDFRQALFGIWLGDKPADRKLKRAMLGR